MPRPAVSKSRSRIVWHSHSVMRSTVLALVTLLGLSTALTGCTEPSIERADPPSPTLVLISIDGFRYDYLDRADIEAPTLRRLAAEGVRAERLVPVYPTKTFPNHYSLVTGLHPEDHGIVGNTMRDPEMLDADGAPASFSLSNREAVADGRWWGGEPIWVTAERQGVRAAPVSWPGSEAEIQGVRPSYWRPYDGDLPYDARVQQALDWLDLLADERPGLVTLYFEAVDTAGHRHGPDAPETAEAIERVDYAIGALVDGLRERGMLETTDLVVVSDHGMAAVSPERRVLLDDAIDLDAVDEVMWGEPVGIWPGDADPDLLVAQINTLPHVRAYRKEDVPARLHYDDNRRIPPVVLIADEGWTVTSRAYVERNPDRPSGGSHGYDNRAESMHGLFLAHGPRFRSGVETGPIQTVDVYGILARALDLDLAPNDGDPSAADRVLR